MPEPEAERQRKKRIQAILDGEDDHFGRSIALALHALILLTAAAFAAATMPDLPETGRRILVWFERAAIMVFVMEYVLRLYAAEHRWRYALSFWGIVDLLAWAPMVFLSISGTSAVRLLRLMHVVRMLKLIRYSHALNRLGRAFNRVRNELLMFYFFALFLVYLSSVGIYFFEHEAQPEVFTSIPSSFWWGVITLTTVGYGDAIPITLGGKLFTSMILFMGMGVFAVPAGVLTSALISRDIEDIEESLEKIESEEKSRKKRMPLPKSSS